MELGLGQKESVVLISAVNNRSEGWSLNQQNLDLVDPDGTIHLELIEQQGELKLIAEVPFAAPSFNSLPLFISQGDTRICVEFSVLPELTITVGGTRDWSFENSFNTPPMIYLRSHPGGVTLRFVYGGESGLDHRIHGDGLIPHAPSNSILSVPGDYYEVLITETAVGVGGYYDHNHQSSQEKRRIEFNSENKQELGKKQFLIEE